MSVIGDKEMAEAEVGNNFRQEMVVVVVRKDSREIKDNCWLLFIFILGLLNPYQYIFDGLFMADDIMVPDE